jgi:hypothetical protein
MEQIITNIEKVENMLKIGTFFKMYRINYNGLRIYVQEEPFMYYSGLTGALNAATFKGDPDSKRLDKWRTSMLDSFGEKNLNDYVNTTADFGTLLHMSLVTIKEKGCINWSEEKDMAYEYFINAFKTKSIEPDLKTIKKMVYEYQKHVASLMQFIYERVNEIYAIETPVKFEELKIATPIDLFCSCRQTPKGEFRNTVINLKTSSQISAHQMEQVACELTFWNSTYDVQAEYAAILRTKDWTECKNPTYDYKYIDAIECFYYFKKTWERLKICLNSESTYYPSPTSKSFNGVTKIGEIPIITTKTLQQEWLETMEGQKTE